MSDELRSEVLASVAERVRAARSDAGLTQEELAGASGVSTRMIQKVEAGVGNPSVVTLVQIAKALNVPTSSLVVDW